MERLRKEYSHEDRELIEKFLEMKRMKSEGLAQELEEKPQLVHGKLDMVNSHLPQFLIYLDSYCM